MPPFWLFGATTTFHHLMDLGAGGRSARVPFSLADRCFEQGTGGGVVSAGAVSQPPGALHQLEAVREGVSIQHHREGVLSHPVGGWCSAVLPAEVAVPPLFRPQSPPLASLHERHQWPYHLVVSGFAALLIQGGPGRGGADGRG